MKKATKFVLLIGLTLGVCLLSAHTASAHTPEVWDECGGLHVRLSNYESTSGPAFNNSVTITIGGVANTYNFDGSFSRDDSWPKTEARSWSVVIDANKLNGNATQYDTSFQGSEAACQTIPTTTTTTTTLAPTTTSTLPATTTTTSSPSSTTLPESTTTILPPTTAPTQTEPPTTVAEQCCPPTVPTEPTTTVTVAPALPVTGTDQAGKVLPWAVLVSCVGGLATLLGRRKPS